MKIIGLRIDGIRKLSAVEMEFAKKGLIEIRGKNRQGKTSIIDSLEILLKGNKYIEKDMIQHGKDRAEIIGYIDEYEIKRVITEKTNRLEIKNKDGLIMKEKPQAFLDKLINALTFDPRPFLDKTPGEKLKFMMDLMEIDFTELNEKIDKQETERLLVGREIKAIGDIKPVEKAEKIDVVALIKEKDSIVELNDKAKDEYQGKREAEIKDVLAFNAEQTTKKENIENAEADLDEIKKKIADLQTKEMVAGQYLVELPRPEPLKDADKIDIPSPETHSTEEIDIGISAAETNNIVAGDYEKYIEKKGEKDAKEKAYELLSAKIRILRRNKAARLKDAKLPLEGLEIREEGIFYNGIFSENWGEQEGLRISSELCLRMDPKLRAVFIDKGEAYDMDQLDEYRGWAIKNDIQAIITIVDSEEGASEGDVYYLEEGKVV